MPGLSFLCHLGARIEDPLIAGVCGADDEEGRPATYATSIIWRDSDSLLLWSGYPEYPVEVHETADYLMCLEGRVYHVSETERHAQLTAIAADIRSGQSHAMVRAERLLAQLDGEFVVTFRDRRSQDVVIFGDCLGRLPLYMSHADLALIVSRDLSFLRRAAKRFEVDRLGVAEFLLYGYPLGSRTLFKHVDRVEAGTAIEVRRKSGEVRISKLAVPTVASNTCMTKSGLKEAATELSSAFRRACAVRVDSRKSTVLGLSGGLDSRCVAAALSAEGLPFVAVTRCPNLSDREVRLAAKVAEILQLNWKTVPLPRPTGADLLRLLVMTNGMNYLSMAFVLPVLDSLQSEFGREMTFLTGDGGDKILPGHMPSARVSTVHGLTDYILAGHEVLPLPTVAVLTGVPVADIVAALHDRIASYPEEALEEKYLHFLVFERAFKWLFPGEDRNRHFFWSGTPFYGREPFVLAMKCPARLKSNYAFYRLVMESLSPALGDVESTTCGPSLDLRRYPMRQFARGLRKWTREVTPLPVKRRVKRLRRQPVKGPVAACIRQQVAAAGPAAAYLSAPDVDAIVDLLEPRQVYTLFTVTSAIEYALSGRSMLEKYRDVVF